jgi:casein kinase 1/casein kinase 1 epsilon
LSEKTGFPEIKYEGKYDGKNIMIMEYLGPSLEDLFEFTGKKFGLKTVLMIGLQILNRIETLHENGIVHRDIKPDNFLIGTGSNKNRIYMIDFGLSKDYVVNGGHIPMKTGRTFTGSFRYSSLRNHKGVEQSRRDDLESIGYMLIYFLKGELPWQGLKGSTKSRRANAIYDVKKNCKLADLCKDIPVEFAKYVKYTRDLKFDDKPDYHYLRSLFIGLFKHEGYDLDYVYDWNIMAKMKKGAV